MAVRVEIYEGGIRAHFTPGGVVYRNGSQLGRRAQTNARFLAPSRTGALRAGITHGIRPGNLHLHVNLNSAVYYSPFVNEGTSGPIRSHSGRAMPLPPYGAYPALRAKTVSGQRGQRFLQRGMNRALASLGYGPFDSLWSEV